jgi:ubiquinone/menaquinone biosynthesis C-methylase UbiE
MPTLLWTGKLSLPLRLMVDMTGIVGWITGNARDSSAMKARMKGGYNGEYSDYIHRYDELSAFHYERISKALLQNVDYSGKELLDVGCGTGILAFLALERGASKVSCLDISALMLGKCREKSIAQGYADDLVSFHEGDAEKLPFDDDTFDVVLSSMVLGMVPNQQVAIQEFTRVLHPGGTLALSTHGPAHYREAIETGLKASSPRYFLDHRFEFWPRDESKIAAFFRNEGLENIQTRRLSWTDEFENGSALFDFYASTSGLWWYQRLPPELRDKETEKTRTYFQRENVIEMTSDVVFASGSRK